MFSLVAYKKEHVIPMLDQPSNLHAKTDYLAGLAEWAETKESFTGVLNGLPVVCGGLLMCWKDRGQIWTVFSEECKSNFIPVFRGIRAYLDQQNEKVARLELSIPCEFELGRRRAELLGFKLECERARKFLPDGTDCALYSRVRE